MGHNCRYLIEDYQQVPAPFGTGTVSEPLWGCVIESDSEVCDETCYEYKPKKKDKYNDNS